VNKAILIVICDFLVSAMLTMMTGMVPAHSGGTGVGLDETTTKLLLAELDSHRTELEKLRRRLAEKSLKLEITTEAKEQIVDKGNAVEYGARPLRRAVERLLEDPLSEELLKGSFANCTGVKVTAGKEALVLTPVLKKVRKRKNDGAEAEKK
jgi:ATP-dependent protease Clp ATPase subunit